MTAINNTDTNANDSKTYPENGKTPTRWGSQYEREIKARIVNDIASGAITIEEMCEMLNLSPNFIEDWQKSFRPDIYGPPRVRIGRKGYQPRKRRLSDLNKGLMLSFDIKRAIVQDILSGKSTIEQSSEQYRVYPSSIKLWLECLKYRNQTKPAAIVAPVSTRISDAELIANNPEFSKVVLNLLLTGHFDKALSVARALLSVK